MVKKMVAPKIFEGLPPGHQESVIGVIDQLIAASNAFLQQKPEELLSDVIITGDEAIHLALYMARLTSYVEDLEAKLKEATDAPMSEKERRKAEMKELLKENLTIGLDMDYDLGSFGSGTTVNATVRVYFDGDEIANGQGYTSIPGVN